MKDTRLQENLDIVAKMPLAKKTKSEKIKTKGLLFVTEKKTSKILTSIVLRHFGERKV